MSSFKSPSSRAPLRSINQNQIHFQSPGSMKFRRMFTPKSSLKTPQSRKKHIRRLRDSINRSSHTRQQQHQQRAYRRTWTPVAVPTPRSFLDSPRSTQTDFEGSPLLLNSLDELLQWKSPQRTVSFLILSSLLYGMHHFVGYSVALLGLDALLLLLTIKILGNFIPSKTRKPKFKDSPVPNDRYTTQHDEEEVALPFDVDGLMLDVLYGYGLLQVWWIQISQIKQGWWHSIRALLLLLCLSCITRMSGFPTTLIVTIYGAFAWSLYGKLRYKQEDQTYFSGQEDELSPTLSSTPQDNDDELAQDLFSAKNLNC